ncbi:MAG: DUF86 domain-containing protein [Magnetococcales bacterium]|nr:DUF86 domain-containing protein [Magnetococcales bacterium]MBF0116340.1 DUF86 domain-containing protein [Magnetococcales bacterium]
MSEAKEGGLGREWGFFLDDMIVFAERGLSYTAGMDRAGFELDGLTYDATVRNLELIGEASTHIPQAVRDASTTIPWRQMIATRNRLIHGYLGIDNDTLWSIIQDDLPVLLANLKDLKERIK